MFEALRHNFEYLSEDETWENSPGTAAEPSNPRCRFLTKTAIIAVISTICITSLVVLTLHLTLFESGRESRASTKLFDDDDDHRQMDDFGYIYSLNGSVDKWDTSTSHLNSIPNRSAPVQLNLANIELNPKFLTQQLAGLTQLRSISLINVTMNGSLGITDRILLPNLKRYVLELNEPIGPNQVLHLENQHCSISDYWSANNLSSFEDQDCLGSLIFFYKPGVRPNWGLNQIFILNTRIQITCFGIHLLVIDPAQGQLTSTLPYSQELLEAYQQQQVFPLRKLTLAGCAIKPSSLLQFSKQLTQLDLIMVNLTTQLNPFPNTAFHVVKEFTALETFKYFGSYISFEEGDTLENFDLHELSSNIKHLRTLSFGFVELDYDSDPSLLSPKIILDQLSLFSVKFKNPELISKFHSLFDVKRLVIDDIHLDTSNVSRTQFILNALKMPSIEYILFGRSIDFLSHSESDNERMASEARVNKTIQDEINTMGIGMISIDFGEVFLLKKNNVTNRWGGRNFNLTNELDIQRIHHEEGFVDETVYKLDTVLRFNYPEN